MAEVKRGTLYGVGLGPGDPELVTIKACKVLEACPVVATPQTSSGQTLALDIARAAVDLSGKNIIALPFCMSRDAEELERSHAQAADLVVRELADGRDVALVNIGDVSIYSTYCYIASKVAAQGFDTCMVPGITSFSAVAAALNQSLTTMNQPLHIVPAGAVDLDQVLELDGTKVLMKSASRIGQTLQAIQRHGLADKASLVRDCGLPTQYICPDIDEYDGGDGYFTTIVIGG